MLIIFLVEAEDERTAQELLEMSRRKKPTSYSMVGVADGKLFCLVVGESSEHGVPSFETPASLARFEKMVAEVLRKHSAKP